MGSERHRGAIVAVAKRFLANKFLRVLYPIKVEPEVPGPEHRRSLAVVRKHAPFKGLGGSFRKFFIS